MDWSSLITLATVGLMFFLMMRHGGGCCGGGQSQRPRRESHESSKDVKTEPDQHSLSR